MEEMNRMRYAEMMVIHHRKAVEMSEALLKNYPSGYMADFAKKVIEAQSKEIKWLQGWINNNSGG